MENDLTKTARALLRVNGSKISSATITVNELVTMDEYLDMKAAGTLDARTAYDIVEET